jgi:S1-C subfamily serine protease
VGVAAFDPTATGFQQRGSAIGRAAFARRQCAISNPSTLFNAVSVPKGESRPAKAERMRGADTYRTVAPAVVVVQTQNGHGTGFLVDSNGLIVTNDHVIRSGLSHDPGGGGSFALVYLGAFDSGGLLTLQAQPVRAYLHKRDASRDLALLRLAMPPSALAALPRLQLADAPPRPGQDCAVIGHPSSGMLWTVRSGQVSAIGQIPRDLVNLVMQRLAASEADRATLTRQLEALPSRKILMTSARVNPGDSGGPVVDEEGRVLGVTFGSPARTDEANFTYHVHLDELKATLADVPDKPVFLVPDWWDIGPYGELADLDNDGRPDALLGGTETPDTVLIDVASANPVNVARDDVSQLIAGKAWRFQLGLQSAAGLTTAFYDTDNDGEVDLVLTAKDKEMADGRFTRATGKAWQYVAGKSAVVDPSYLRDAALAARARRLLGNLR